MVLAVYAAVPALAVHDTGVFELDKNAVQDTPPAEDWQNVCDEANPPSTCLNNSTASAHTFETDVAGQSIFTGAQSGGSSKDPQLISGWRWKSGSVPDKDEILHGYAARYSKAPDTTPPTLCPAGTNPTCELLYFGADRFDASGDSQIGFWFYQNRVSCIPPVGGSDCASNDSTAHKFTGEHKDGDILALSDFVGGGETPSIKVFEWNFDPTPGTNPADDGALPGGGNGSCSNHVCDDLIPLLGITNADCGVAGAGDAACAVVNTGSTTSPWAFKDKSGNTSFATAEFYEGGINLSLLPAGIASECFSSFSVETRSSATPDAVLKDFVLGNFGNCSASMTTQVSSTSVIPGAQVRDTATVVGSQPSLTPSGNVTFYLCSFAAGTTDLCDGTAGHVGNQLTPDGTLSGSGATATANSPYVNTAANPLGPGRYCFRAHWGGDINYTTPIDEYGQSSNSVECFTVAKLPSGTVTTPSTGTVTLASINAGGFVTDTAVVTGTAAGGDPTGTVNFFICGPIASGTCDGTTNVGTAVSGNPVDLVPDGTVPPNDTTYTGSATSGHVTSSTITSVGRYCFRAVYSGDGHYLGSNDAGTGNSECFTVTDTSSETTEQNWLPNDSATVSSGGGTTLDGTGVFTLYDSANCSGTVLYSSDPTPGTNPADDIVVGGGSTVTVNTGNQTFKIKVADDRTVSWQFVYTSNDSSTTGSTSSCETTNLTITN